MLSIRTATAFVVWTVAGFVRAGLFLDATPWLEARYAPVLREQKVVIDAGDRTPS